MTPGVIRRGWHMTPAVIRRRWANDAGRRTIPG
jgi:hypothetical protein